MMNFGEALEAIHNGERVQRDGWNGKNMFVYLLVFPSTEYNPCICLFNAQGKHQPGWVPSQGDMAANDWSIVNSNIPEFEQIVLPL